MRSAAFFLLLLTSILGNVARASGQTAGVTMTPDRLHLLVNKDLGAERWSISMNLSANDPTRIVSVTGNVYRSDDETVSFVHCAARPDSTGSLSDASSAIRFTCRGMGGCTGNALGCARSAWTPLTRDVSIPASFFLPPGGRGGSGSSASAPSERLARLLRDVWRELGGAVRTVAPRDAAAQSTTLAAATLTPDLLSHLVLRDRDDARWSIAFNVVRDDTRAGGFKPTSVTGNVFRGSDAPAFVYCVPRSGSPVTLEDPTTELHFVCLGTSGCETNAEECASGWSTISDDAVISAGFFLPPDGRGTPPSSDEKLLLVGGASGLPSIASDGYKGSGTGSCDDGAACEVDRIAGCEDVQGRLIEVDGVCRCYVSPVASACFRTGTETVSKPRIPAACGDACSFEVGVPAEDRTNGTRRVANGVSLPLEADSPNCYCHANPPGRIRGVESCGGAEGTPCAGDRCCVDDPRDGCDPLAGDAACAGICIDPSENPSLDAPTCAKHTTASQFCGDGLIQGNEVCDPATSPAPTCASLSYAGGTLDCSGCIPVGCTDVDEAPQITSLEALPDEIDAHSRYAVRGTFSDRDGDVTQAVLTKSTGEQKFYDLAVAGRRSGTFEVFVGCNGVVDGDDSMLDYTVALLDAAKNEGDDMAVTSQCVEPPLCGDGKKEGAERCDPGSDDPADACPNNRVCRNDCTCGKPKSCAGRCCPDPDGFCGHAELDCRCDPHCRDADRNDCCDDAKAECGL
ncbi:hypothetical protein K2Z84_31860 [Candidatus Binatia bacterium]|nr:hypothetical protein [Candidatus Binatia bacterium]